MERNAGYPTEIRAAYRQLRVLDRYCTVEPIEDATDRTDEPRGTAELRVRDPPPGPADPEPVPYPGTSGWKPPSNRVGSGDPSRGVARRLVAGEVRFLLSYLIASAAEDGRALPMYNATDRETIEHFVGDTALETVLVPATDEYEPPANGGPLRPPSVGGSRQVIDVNERQVTVEWLPDAFGIRTIIAIDASKIHLARRPAADLDPPDDPWERDRSNDSTAELAVHEHAETDEWLYRLGLVEPTVEEAGVLAFGRTDDV